MYGRDLEVIYLLAYGWCVREEGTKTRIRGQLPSQAVAISAARDVAEERVAGGVRSVEVRIKTRWLKRIRDTRTYGVDAPRPRG